jgi:DNA repair exonuclease SbcCD ATPase subunit
MEQVLINLKGDYCAKFFNKDLVSVDEILNKLYELENDIEDLKEELEELKDDMEDNYIHRPMSHYTGDSYDDRF